MSIELLFHESGGYDSMTGAWSVVRRATNNGVTVHQELVLIDQSEYGQEHCDYPFRSEEAKAVAQACYETLKRMFL